MERHGHAERDAVELERERDPGLVEELRDGTSEGFDAFYLQYFRRIYEFVARRVDNRTDAEDLTQEVFLAVFRSMDSFEGRSGFDSWVFGVARNVVHDHVRRVARRGSRSEDAAAATGPRSESPPTPEEELLLRRLMAGVREHLRSVEGWRAQAFRMRYFEMAPLREIARRTERTRYAVQTSLERMRRRVTRDLEP